MIPFGLRTAGSKCNQAGRKRRYDSFSDIPNAFILR